MGASLCPDAVADKEAADSTQNAQRRLVFHLCVCVWGVSYPHGVQPEAQAVGL